MWSCIMNRTKSTDGGCGQGFSLKNAGFGHYVAKMPRSLTLGKCPKSFAVSGLEPLDMP